MQRERLVSAVEMSPVITVNDVTKHYGPVAALNGISFQVEAGEAVALWGPNGAGKTTVLRCLLGLAKYSGDIRVGGKDPHRDGRAVRQIIGYVPQDLPVSPATVGEMAAFVATIKRASLETAMEHLATLGIAEQVNKPIGALSGGMKQRLALALALIGSPQILLLDEPTANLDARGRAELLDLLRGYHRQGLTVVFSSHRPDDVLALSDRILMIERGVLRRSATPAEFREELGAATNLVLVLKNGHLREALDTLTRLGLAPTGSGHVVSVPVPARDKARVLTHLAKQGIEIDDFDMERL